ncbi:MULTISPECIES: hypothetical protein [unclassified Afipia]|uniref:hypothetical protein n=1 Tax=unclassified Afipia TaxID=2642050 RepID=UPI001FCC181D|nr:MULTISPECIES: hypothetical protein [unclassified Afipia]
MTDEVISTEERKRWFIGLFAVRERCDICRWHCSRHASLLVMLRRVKEQGRDTNVFFRTAVRALLASVVFAPTLFIPMIARGQGSEWPAALVCQASVQSYFNLPQPPRQIDESFGWLIFRSSLGGVYDCKVWGSSVSLKWKSHNGTMSNSRTEVDANGPVLTVRPGGTGQWRFRRIADGYGLLNEGRHR